MNAPSIRANGINISYRDSGGDKQPLIFIHGFPFSQSMWDTQWEALKSNTRIITYDIRGFGRSEAGSEKASIRLYADDLIAFMDALGIKKAMVCGLSMGGYILLNAMERYAARFSAVVLADTQCLADSEEGKKKRYNTIKEIEENGLEPFAEKFLKGAFSKKAHTDKKEAVGKIKQIILSTSEETVKAALAALAERKETCSHLKDIKIPTLILCGEEDELTTIPQSEFLFNTISGSKMHAIEKAGHLSNVEQPEVFNKYLENFLRKL